MLRFDPKPSIFERVARPLVALAKHVRWRSRQEQVVPIRLRRMATPSVRSLEPRFVLNATAELTALGQLLITGSDAADTIELQIEADGRLRLRDQAGDVIAIDGHPSGDIGETDPLDPAAIFSGQIVIDSRGGDDILRLQLPSNLDVTVLASDGNDTALIGGATTRFGDPLPVNTGGLVVDSETVRFDERVRSFTFNDTVRIRGDVSLGMDGESTELSATSGSPLAADFELEGRLVIAGDVMIQGDGGGIDLSLATLTADSLNSDLTIDAGVGELAFGGADASGGFRVRDLTLESAAELAFTGQPTQIDGDLTVTRVENLLLVDTDIEAGSISMETSSDVELRSTLVTTSGDLRVATTETLTLSGELDASGANNAAIELSATEIEIDESQIRTSGGDVTIDGDIRINGLWLIDTGNNQSVANAGDVLIQGDIQSTVLVPSGPNSNPTPSGSIRVDARGTTMGGRVEIVGDMGRTPVRTGALDLNGVEIAAASMAIGNIGVTGGNIQLQATSIDRIGNSLRTSDSGYVLIDAAVVLPMNDMVILAAEDVTILSPLTGVVGTRDLSIASGGDVRLEGAVTELRNLNVTAAETIRLNGPIELAGSLNADGDRIDVTEDVTTLGDGITLSSRSSLTVRDDAVLEVNDGQILLDGGGGTIDTTLGSLRSLSQGDAITIRNASSVAMGNTVASAGTLRFGDNTGSVTQDAGTSVNAQRLTGTVVGSMTLDNPGNELGIVDTLTIQDDLVLRDSVDDLNLTRVTSTSGNVTVTATGDLQLGIDAVIAASGNVVLDARSINDAADDNLRDVVANTVTTKATAGIGNTNRIELGSIERLTATTDAGGIDLHLLATQNVMVDRIEAGAGDVRLGQTGPDHQTVLEQVVTRSGQITVATEGSVRANDVSATGGDISITTTGAASDIGIRRLVANGPHDVTLVSGDDILDTDLNDEHRLVARDLRLRANNATAPMAGEFVAIQLSTQVMNLAGIRTAGAQQMVAGPNFGDVEIYELDTIRLATSSDAGDDIVSTSNGQIIVHANEIEVIDSDGVIDGGDRKSDPEIVAGGSRGRIELIANQRLELGDDVQLHAAKQTGNPPPNTQSMPLNDGLTRNDRAVYLQAPIVKMGERIEIMTEGQGVARAFGPRPSMDIAALARDPFDNIIHTAFFDPQNIDVNILEQAAVNDANGILTIDIGQEGEQGLSVEIDWGAGDPARRFQVLSGLSADQTLLFDVDAAGNPIETPIQSNGDGRLSITHFYTQNDILNSTENGRPSATDPLNVLFAVRHHQSILVVGNVIEQNGARQEVEGGVLSTTDNPGTSRDVLPGLESGRASFVIPELSIPVAFFPIREVIPEIETREVIVRPVSTIRVDAGRVDTVEVATASTSTRDEYFRLRVLSPDPSASDLAEPQRLPPDILSGDKINLLFESLPDGRYEVEYVLGDGNERTILRVDVRNGAAKISGGELEEGPLELKRVQ